MRILESLQILRTFAHNGDLNTRINMDEQQLLCNVARGDIGSFERIFRLYHPRLVAFLIGLLHDEDEGRDMAQDIFMSLWENREKLSEVKSFSAYLFRMARCAVYNYYDHLNVESKYASEYLLNHIDDSFSEEEKIFARELNAAIDRVADSLSAQRKRIYVMSRKEHLSNDEIAKSLGINKRTVENHLSAVLSALRKLIVSSVVLFALGTNISILIVRMPKDSLLI